MELGIDELRACCAAQRWLGGMRAAAPYADLGAMLAASDRAVAELDWPDIEQALAAHPRIGERAAGDSQEARWSRGEQSATATDDAALRAELIEGNRRYEQRFGHVFLICATGLSLDAVLSALRDRLANDAETERAVVREELRKIVRLRLAKACGTPAPGRSVRS